MMRAARDRSALLWGRDNVIELRELEESLGKQQSNGKETAA